MSHQPSAHMEDIEADRRRLDGRIIELEEHLRKLEGPPGRPPSSAPRKPSRLTAAGILKVLLGLIAYWCLCLAWTAIFSPDKVVLLTRDGSRFEVWDSADGYEAVTGRNWLEDDPRAHDFIKLHGARRQLAMQLLAPLVLLGAGILLALRRLKQADASRIAPPTPS